MKNYNTFAMIPLLMGIYFCSCESHEQKADAFETLKNEKLNSNGEIVTVTDTIYIPEVNTKSGKVKVAVGTDEWTLFKLQTEQKITLNELKIKEIKNLANTTAKTIRKIVSLEKENNGLHQQMVDYIQEEKVRWATFKAKINQDASTITLAIKDAEITN